MFANYLWSQNKDNGASERDTDTYFGQQDPFNINLDYGRNSLDIRQQFKMGGVVDLPWGFLFSSSVIAHSGVPFPLYIDVDVNGDGVANSGYSHNNDRPSIQIGGGKPFLLQRYPFNQPDFIEWDARLAKDFKLGERFTVELSGDFYNVTNRHNCVLEPRHQRHHPSDAGKLRCRGPRSFPMSQGQPPVGSSCCAVDFDLAVVTARASRRRARRTGRFRRWPRGARRSRSRQGSSSFSNELRTHGAQAVSSGTRKFDNVGGRRER